MATANTTALRTAKTRARHPDTRTLRHLAGVGPAIEKDFHLLGVHDVPALAASNGDELYRRLCQLTGTRQDPCVLDTFRCAVAQARDPGLPADQSNWWWWSRLRKRGDLPSG
jgi:hypothetical protein